MTGDTGSVGPDDHALPPSDLAPHGRAVEAGVPAAPSAPEGTAEAHAVPEAAPEGAPQAAPEGAPQAAPEASADAHAAPTSWRSRFGRLGHRLSPWRSTAFGIALAVFVVIALARLGFIVDYDNTLQVMGFDPDRAVLITALLMGAIGAVMVALPGGRLGVALITGAGIALVAFYNVFRQETRAALQSAGADGVFDPLGWGLSALTLITMALATGWAGAVLGRDVAARIDALRVAVRDDIGRPGHRHRGRALGRLAAVAAICGVLAVTVQFFGDMVNFAPDAHMRQGAPPGVALFGGNPEGGPGAPAPFTAVPTGPGSPASGSPGDVLITPGDLVPGPVPGSYVTGGALAPGRPWAAHLPSGAGRTFSVDLPAPWVEGIRDVATLDIYLPPGYDSGSARYPVIYEPHEPLWAWEQGTHITSLLDTLILSGTFPAEIVVFVGQAGGPFPDSECADSYDGREWFDRYLGLDVPAYVDANFRTIPTLAARALLGFSSGGYCAAAAITHHPEVFGTALIFSGYFEAGKKTSTTPGAGRPFNDDPQLEANVSPINVLPRLSATERSQMFLAFSADPTNRFFANQVNRFTGVLDAAGVPMAILPSTLGHSWAAVRNKLPDMLSLLAARQAVLGVFGGV